MLLVVSLFCSCKKDVPNTGNNYDSKKYSELTKSQLLKLKVGSTSSLIESFPTPEEIQSHQTFILIASENGDDSSVVFITPIYRDDVFICGIIGFYEDSSRRLLNTVWVPETLGETSTIGVYYISGDKLGSYSILNDKITSTTIELEMEGPQEQARSWWSCVSDCVSDANIACYQDSECMTLLFISNLPTGSGLAGLGSLSIGAACGVSCVKDKELDLLPAY